jgi:chromosome segregation ATPase
METEQNPTQPDEVKTPETEVVETTATPVPPRKMPRWLRLGLIGLGIVVLLFLAGFLTDHFVRYQPLNASYITISQQAADLQKQVTGLKDELTAANAQIVDLKSNKTGLQSDLATALTHVELLRAMSEIQAAQVALANADVSGAKVALVDTPKRLENLKSAIAPVDAALAENMSARLDTAIAAIDTNIGAAKTTLATLANNLLNIEALLYKKIA